MKHRTLRLVAYSMAVIAWILLVCGIAASIIIAVKAATSMAQITFLLGGLLATAINTVLLLATSKLIYLFLSVEEHLEEISNNLKKTGSVSN